MATVTFKGEPINVGGTFPRVGDSARSFMLVDKDLNDVSLSQFAGRRKILNIVPSLDTPVCQASARKFRQISSAARGTAEISTDWPSSFKIEDAGTLFTVPMRHVSVSGRVANVKQYAFPVPQDERSSIGTRVADRIPVVKMTWYVVFPSQFIPGRIMT